MGRNSAPAPLSLVLLAGAVPGSRDQAHVHPVPLHSSPITRLVLDRSLSRLTNIRWDSFVHSRPGSSTSRRGISLHFQVVPNGSVHRLRDPDISLRPANPTRLEPPRTLLTAPHDHLSDAHAPISSSQARRPKKATRMSSPSEQTRTSVAKGNGRYPPRRRDLASACLPLRSESPGSVQLPATPLPCRLSF